MKNKYLVLLGCILMQQAKAQQAINNTGNMQIHTGASVSFFGAFTNASTAALLNNGSWYVKKDFTNYQAGMSAGTGTLQLNGTTAQTIGGTQKILTLNLVTNNSNGVTLNNDLSVSGVHSFTSGLITTSATPNYLIYEAGASYSGDNDSRHVNGWVKKLGNTAFVFPTGNASIERSIKLTSLSANSEFATKYNSPTPNTSQFLPPLVYIDGAEYWTVNRISGSGASVELNWDYSKVYFPHVALSEISVAAYNGSNWTDQGGVATGNVNTTGTITSNSQSSFNLFTFGTKANPLPLTLLSLKANRTANYTAVLWTTAQEQNVNYFEVEKSDNGMQFSKFTTQPARNSGRVERYTANDYSMLEGTAYYRLKMVDNDGKLKFSPVVSVTAHNAGTITLVTNRVNNELTLVASKAANGSFDYQVFAMNGQLMQKGKLTMRNGGQYEILLNGTFRTGSYLLVMSNDQGNSTFQFEVAR